MVWALLKRIFFKSPTKETGRKSSWPTREEIALLPLFDGLELNEIVVVSTVQEAQRAHDTLTRASVVGFDTESKPTFTKGHVSTGPHVVQFATAERAYVFPLHHEKNREVACALIGSATVLKVGFGLRDDLKRIPIKLGVKPKATLDLETLFAKQGYGRGVGVKVAVAIAFKQRFQKSRRASTSNWMNRHLTSQQILYAANDAYAAIRVYQALESPHHPVFKASKKRH